MVVTRSSNKSTAKKLSKALVVLSPRVRASQPRPTGPQTVSSTSPSPPATPILLDLNGQRFFPLGEERHATVKRYNGGFSYSVLATSTLTSPVTQDTPESTFANLSMATPKRRALV